MTFFFFLQVDPRRDPVAPVPLGVSSYANTALRDTLKLLWRLTPDSPRTPGDAAFRRLLPLPSAPSAPLDYGRRFNWTIPAPRGEPRILEEITSTPR